MAPVAIHADIPRRYKPSVLGTLSPCAVTKAVQVSPREQVGFGDSTIHTGVDCPLADPHEVGNCKDKEDCIAGQLHDGPREDDPKDIVVPAHGNTKQGTLVTGSSETDHA